MLNTRELSLSLSLSLAIAASTLFASACEMEAVEDENVQVAAEGKRWMPGHYLIYAPSRRHEESKRIDLANAFLSKNGSKPGVRGVVMFVDWDRLEKSKGNYDTPTMRAIGTWLDAVEGTEQGIGLSIRTRNFGTDDANRAFVPKYVKEDYCVTTYGGYVALPCLWEKETMDRKIALIAEIARRYDDHPNFALLSSGETSLNGEGFSHEKWKTQLTRYLVEGKKSLKNAILVNEMNFLGGGAEAMHKIAQKMSDIGGVGYGWPDTVPCKDSTRSEECGYKISSYDVARSYRGELPITPNVESWNILPSELNDIFEMLTGSDANSMEANYVLWRTTFTSRRWADKNNGDGTYSNWLPELLALLKKENGRINTELPTSMRGEDPEPRPDAGVPDSGQPVDPDAGQPVDPDAGQPVDPDAGETPEPDADAGVDLCEFDEFFC